MTGESSRSRARELVLQTLYACEHGDSDPDETFADIAEENPLGEKNTRFATNLLHLVIDNSEAADKHIADLAENWHIERIAAIDRNILRMAMIELDLIPDTPVKVVLNEAIELAKKFSTVESSKFVNGILDNYVKQQRQLK